MSEQPGNLTLNERYVQAMELRARIEQEEFAEKRAAKEEGKKNHAAKVERRKSQEKYEWDTLEKFQMRCDHRKGTAKKGKNYIKAKQIDYMVYRHRFANGVTVIKCQKCKFKAFPDDTAENCFYTMENYINKGKKRPNPTKKSYNDWFNMTLEENTTNQESTAEMVVIAQQAVGGVPVNG